MPPRSRQSADATWRPPGRGRDDEARPTVSPTPSMRQQAARPGTSGPLRRVDGAGDGAGAAVAYREAHHQAVLEPLSALLAMQKVVGSSPIIRSDARP